MERRPLGYPAGGRFGRHAEVVHEGGVVALTPRLDALAARAEAIDRDAGDVDPLAGSRRAEELVVSLVCARESAERVVTGPPVVRGGARVRYPVRSRGSQGDVRACTSLDDAAGRSLGRAVARYVLRGSR